MAHRMKVPDGEEPTLKFIAQLSEVDFQKLQVAIVETEPSPYTTRFIKRVLDKAGHEGDEKWYDTVSTVLAISNAAEHFGTSTTRAASDLASELRDRSVIVPEESERLQSRLTDLLSIQSVDFTSQADKSLGLREDMFSSATITTQLHPLFTNVSDDLTLAATVLSHELRIEVYGSTERMTTIRAVLDDADLRALRTEIDRALTRRKAIQTMVDKSGATLLREDTVPAGEISDED
jgi:hypothetical protein